jgi:hypothetical protein
MSNLAKLNSLKDQLKSKLEGRIKGQALPWTVVESSDTQGPILLIKDGSAVVQVALRYKSQANQFTDVLGLAKSAYAPSVCQVIEAGSATVSTVLLKVKMDLDWELARQGVFSERFTDAAPAASMFAADGSCTATNSFGVLSSYNWPQSGQ